MSVVAVSYNGRKYLPELLDSLLDQDFPRDQYEIVVVDNGSQDGSPELVEHNYPGVRLIRLARNHGPAQALVLAFGQLRGRYLAYVNQDVVAHRRWLAELLTALLANPDAGLVESNAILPPFPEYVARRREGTVDRAYVWDLTSFGVYDVHPVPVTPDSPPIPVLGALGAALLLDPQIQDTLGYVVEPGFFVDAEDMDLGLRLNAAGHRVLLVPQSIIYHSTRWHFTWSKRSLGQALWVTRNTILAFYKVSYTSEFLVLLPRLLLGKALKAAQRCPSRRCRLLCFLAALPMVGIGLVAALVKMPIYRDRRRTTMQHRKMPRGWLVERLLH